MPPPHTTPPPRATPPAAATSDEPDDPSLAPTEGGPLLPRLGLEAGHCAVVGLQWGDEGKGKVADLLMAADPGFGFVVRYNGGANAGHSLQVGDERYALHLIPSGILHPDKTNVLGNGVVIDPAQLVKEITELRRRGLAIGDNLKVSDRAHVVLPYHKAHDVLLDKAAKSPIGTTGRGIGPCYGDKALRTTAIRMGELLDMATLRPKLTRILQVKNAMLQALAQQAGETLEPFEADALADELADHAEVIAPHLTDTAALLHGVMEADRRLLFEGANATLLDIDHGTYPFVTSSNCSSLGVHPGTGIPGHRVAHVLGIVKAYQTRVGGGPMPTELKDATGERLRKQGNEFGTTTGRPRRCGWLDLVALRYTAAINGATALALMLVDVLAGLDQLKLCTAYQLDGKTLDHFPADAAALERVQPVYETLAGFGEMITGCRKFSELPEAGQRYIQRIEQVVGVPIMLISVGPQRDQTVLR